MISPSAQYFLMLSSGLADGLYLTCCSGEVPIGRPTRSILLGTDGFMGNKIKI